MTEPLPRLYAIADLQFAGDEATWLDGLRRLARAAAAGEFPARIVIQIRARQLAASALATAAARARAAIGDASLTVLNGPAELAARLGYHGVHWPESQVPQAPPASPALAFVSAAAHSIEAVRRAERAGANAVLFGPVFKPGWKPGNPTGLRALQAAAATTSLSVYALGGATIERSQDCLAHGAHGVATVSGIFADDAPAAVRRYLGVLGTPHIPSP